MTGLTPAQFQDFANFRRYLTVERLVGDNPFVPFNPNNVQRTLSKHWIDADNDERPFRCTILKARRMGMSTLIQARMMHRSFTRMHHKTVTIAHDLDTAEYLHGMSEGMYERLPSEFRREVPKARTNLGRLMLLKNGSSMRTATAGTKTAGRGKGNQIVHASEVALWGDDAAKTMLSLKQTVPAAPFTAFIEESTANGVGNYFFHAYQRAKRGTGGYIAVFFAWFEFEEYTLPGQGKHIKILDSREERLVEQYGVTRDQLAWRRMAIEDFCGGDEDFFDQEYPESDEVAFLTSGRPFFKGLDRCRPKTPIWIGDLDGQPVRGGMVKAERDSDGALRIWEQPVRDERYAIFLDVAGIATGREFAARKDQVKEDYSCAYVISLDSAHLVANLHGRWDHDELAVEVARLGRLYNTAVIAVERTGGYGGSVLLELNKHLNYPRLYRDRHYEAPARDELGTLGWNTSQRTKPLMVNALQATLRDYPSLIVDEALVGEMQTFEKKDSGKSSVGAAIGCYDDRVMSAGGAYAIFNELAMTSIDLRKRVTPKRQVSLQSRAPRSVA